MNISKVSILLPLYNNKNDVINSINSILSQTYRNWELIIIDDCSTDGSYELVKNSIEKLSHNNIFLIRTICNSGTYVALNEGLLRATGKYITIIGSDDKFHPTKVQKQARILDRFPSKMAVIVLYAREGVKPTFGESTIMFRREIINKIGYHDSVRFGADSEFFSRIIKVYTINAIVYLNEILYIAKRRQNSLTTSNITGCMGHGKLVRKDYVTKYTKWHNTAKNLYIPYPLKKRPFKVKSLMLTGYMGKNANVCD